MKVLIIGAGPSGLACAEQILEQRIHSLVGSTTGFDVTVVDQKFKIGEPQRCAGGVSLYMIEKVGFSVPESCIVAKVRRVRIYAPNMDYWDLKGDRDYGYILNRELLEQNMAEEVVGLGGKIVLGHLVSLKDLEFWQGQYDYVVGADGPVSVVRQWLNLPKLPSRDIHLGVQKTITMEDYPQDTIELYFGGEVAPRGYAWIFPGGNGLIRVGLGVPLSEQINAGELLGRFIERRVYNYKTTNFLAKQIPTAKMPKSGMYGRVLLVGDALPSTDPLTGGGICQGIVSGKAAGRAIAEGDPALYDDYIGWLRKQNNRRYRLKNVLLEFNDKDLNELIQVMQGFRPKTMSIGAEMRRAIVRLLWRKPRLLGKFFKALL